MKRTPFRLSRPQLQILMDKHRFKIVNAGRRFGKSFVAGAIILWIISHVRNAKIWYIAPTWDMARRIMWDDWLPNNIPKEYIENINKMDKTYTFINGAMLYVLSADNPEHLRGSSLDYVIMDECAFIKKGVWEKIRPALADKQGGALLISTPQGYNWFYERFQKAKEDDEWGVFEFTTLDGGNVPAEEIEASKKDMSPEMFAQEYLAKFETLSNRVYYLYDREKNLCDFDETWGLGDIHVGIDFNVNPMTAAIAVQEHGNLMFFDEIVDKNSDTQRLCNEIRRRYPKADIFAYPDPTCRKRQPSAPAGITDYEILRRNHFHVCCPKASYPSRDKFNAVNSALCNAKGERRVFIARNKCYELKKAFDGYCYKENVNDTDKSGGLDHISDAAAYLICYKMPIKSRWGLNRPKVYGF